MSMIKLYKLKRNLDHYISLDLIVIVKIIIEEEQDRSCRKDQEY